MGLQAVLLVALGGALGAVMRVALVTFVAARTINGFPYGTLLVNVSGSLLIGVLAVAMQVRYPDSLFLRYALIGGLLGSFTTFSAFSLETLHLVTSGAALQAGVNVAANVVLCLAAALAGVWLAKAGLNWL